MIGFDVGDRVEVSNFLGTIISTENDSPTQFHDNITTTKISVENGIKDTNLRSNSQGDRTFVVEWDDLTKGEFDYHSNRLHKIRNIRLSIFNYLKAHNNQSIGATTDPDNPGAYNRLIERLSIIDSYKPCSMVKLDQISTGITFEEGFKSKYLCEKENIQTIKMEDSDRIYEFVGVDSAFNFFSDARKLFIVDLNGMKISTVGNIEKFPKCSDFYINNNLLNSSKINNILEYFPKLKILDVSSNRIDLPIESNSISTIIMNSCNVELDTLLKTLEQSKNLEILVMCNNLLNDIEYFGTQYPMVRSVDLSNNYIYKWDTVNTLLHLFPNLSRLALENNYVSHVDCPEDFTFLNLSELDISNNLIEDLNEFVKISHIFPNLTKLKVNCNPINLTYVGRTTGSSNTVINGLISKLNSTNGVSNNNNSNHNELIRMFMIVTFPNITVLNCTSITQAERTNYERYLTQRPSKSTPVANNMGPTPNKIKVMLIPDGDSDSFKYEPVEKSLKESYTVLDLKLLCSSLFKMNLKDIKLIYNSKMMPLCEELDDDAADLCSYGISDGYEIRVQNRQLII